MRKTVTNEQRENLEKLSDYLLSGELKAQFTMARFCLDIDDGLENCGTCGCAVGHGPYAGIPKDRDESFWEYSTRVFGLGHYGPAWEFLFGADWKDVDDTPEGAGRRIKHYLGYDIRYQRFVQEYEDYNEECYANYTALSGADLL